MWISSVVERWARKWENLSSNPSYDGLLLYELLTLSTEIAGDSSPGVVCWGCNRDREFESRLWRAIVVSMSSSH